VYVTLLQTSTIYKVENTLLPKEYKFKVQVIRETHGIGFHHHGEPHQRRKTVARTKVNLAEYCTLSTTAAAQIVDVPLTPQGSLTLSIRAVWLQNWKKTKSSRSGGTSENESETDFSSIAGSDHSGGSVEGHAGNSSASNNCADLPPGEHQEVPVKPCCKATVVLYMLSFSASDSSFLH
jgi:hypothetical protein